MLGALFWAWRRYYRATIRANILVCLAGRHCHRQPLPTGITAFFVALIGFGAVVVTRSDTTVFL